MQLGYLNQYAYAYGLSPNPKSIIELTEGIVSSLQESPEDLAYVSVEYIMGLKAGFYLISDPSVPYRNMEFLGENCYAAWATLQKRSQALRPGETTEKGEFKH